MLKNWPVLGVGPVSCFWKPWTELLPDGELKGSNKEVERSKSKEEHALVHSCAHWCRHLNWTGQNVNSELGRSYTPWSDMGKLHPINKEQHCCWMCTEAFSPVCFHWILFKNTSCRHQRTMAHHWKNSVLTPGSVAQYLFCQGLCCCALLRPRSLKAVSDTRDQLYATTKFEPSKKCWGWSQEDL